MVVEVGSCMMRCFLEFGRVYMIIVVVVGSDCVYLLYVSILMCLIVMVVCMWIFVDSCVDYCWENVLNVSFSVWVCLCDRVVEWLKLYILILVVFVVVFECVLECMLFLIIMNLIIGW